MAAPDSRRVGNPFRESVRVLGVYIRAQVLIGIILTVLYAISFYFAKVPLWPWIAVLGGLASVIPSVGSLIPLGLAALTILWVDQDPVHLAIAFGCWVVIQAIEGFFLQPVLMGRSMGLNALLVFFALIVGSLTMGPIGLIVAVPILAVARIFWTHFREKSGRAAP